jgi:hypothetical protein
MKFAFDLQQQPEPREVALTHRPTISFDDWLAAFWLNCFPPRALAHFPLSSPCTSCQQPPHYTLTLRFTCTPPIIFFNVADWDLQTNAFLPLSLVMVDGTPNTYRLCAVIYHGGNHWTSRWVTSNGHVWGHDGQKHRGALESDGKMEEPCGRSKLCSLRTYGSRTLSILVYALDSLTFACTRDIC